MLKIPNGTSSTVRWDDTLNGAFLANLYEDTPPSGLNTEECWVPGYNGRSLLTGLFQTLALPINQYNFVATAQGLDDYTGNSTAGDFYTPDVPVDNQNRIATFARPHYRV